MMCQAKGCDKGQDKWGRPCEECQGSGVVYCCDLAGENQKWEYHVQVPKIQVPAKSWIMNPQRRLKGGKTRRLVA